jgi:hypothetical protein
MEWAVVDEPAKKSRTISSALTISIKCEIRSVDFAKSKGIFTEFNQGKQQSGESRAPKFALEISKAREDAMKKEELNL